MINPEKNNNNTNTLENNNQPIRNNRNNLVTPINNIERITRVNENNNGNNEDNYKLVLTVLGKNNLIQDEQNNYQVVGKNIILLFPENVIDENGDLVNTQLFSDVNFNVDSINITESGDSYLLTLSSEEINLEDDDYQTFDNLGKFSDESILNTNWNYGSN